MKRPYLTFIRLFMICLSAYAIWVSIALSHARRARAVTLQADFLSSFSVAEALRGGKPQEALFRTENHAYATAAQLFGIPGEKSRILQSSAAKLRAYRSKYAADTSSWSVVEQRLEYLLNSQHAEQSRSQ
jgi:hypothetical protein